MNKRKNIVRDVYWCSQINSSSDAPKPPGILQPRGAPDSAAYVATILGKIIQWSNGFVERKTGYGKDLPA